MVTLLDMMDDGRCLGVFTFTISVIVAISTVITPGLGSICGVEGCGDIPYGFLNEITNSCSNDWMFCMSESENVYN